MNTWTLGASALLHAALFGLFSFLAVQEVQYGIQTGHSSVEVELVAAPASAQDPPLETWPDPAPPSPAADDPDLSMPAPRPEPRPSLPPPPSPVLRSPNPGRSGDGSSPVPGSDATTRRSDGGAQDGQARPNYLRNPPPPYPEQARQKKQEGLVLIRVRVTPEGRAGSVQVDKSSGWPLLDQAALRAVRNWRFHPARAAGIAVASEVVIPVRFDLR